MYCCLVQMSWFWRLGKMLLVINNFWNSFLKGIWWTWNPACLLLLSVVSLIVPPRVTIQFNNIQIREVKIQIYLWSLLLLYDKLDFWNCERPTIKEHLSGSTYGCWAKPDNLEKSEGGSSEIILVLSQLWKKLIIVTVTAVWDVVGEVLAVGPAGHLWGVAGAVSLLSASDSPILAHGSAKVVVPQRKRVLKRPSPGRVRGKEWEKQPCEPQG